MADYPTGREGQRARVIHAEVSALMNKEGVIIDDAGPGCTLRIGEGEYRFYDYEVEVIS